MENNLHSSTQSAKNKMPSFEELYQTKLVGAVEKFKAVRRKLYFSTGFTISGIIILASVFFMMLNFLEYKDVINTLKVWLFLFVITIIFLLISAGKRKIDKYNWNLIVIYIFFNFIGFFLFNFFNDIESYKNSLLLCVSMISVSIGLIIFIASGILDNYTRQYRKIVIGELVKNMGINMKYTPEGVVSKQEFRDSGMKITSSGDYAGCDLIELEYGGQ